MVLRMEDKGWKGRLIDLRSKNKEICMKVDEVRWSSGKEQIRCMDMSWARWVLE